MSTIEIAKDSFPWEAFATAFTGVIAVCGAVWVGLNQTEVARKQTEILSQQIRIQKISAQSELFDRRFAVHEATLAVVEEAIRKHDFPDAADQEFLKQREAARFLFSSHVIAKLNLLRDTLIEMEFQKNTAADEFDPTKRAEALKKVSETGQYLRSLMKDGQVADFFLKEMAIGHPTAP